MSRKRRSSKPVPRLPDVDEPLELDQLADRTSSTTESTTEPTSGTVSKTGGVAPVPVPGEFPNSPAVPATDLPDTGQNESSSGRRWGKVLLWNAVSLAVLTGLAGLFWKGSLLRETAAPEADGRRTEQYSETDLPIAEPSPGLSDEPDDSRGLPASPIPPQTDRPSPKTGSNKVPNGSPRKTASVSNRSPSAADAKPSPSPLTNPKNVPKPKKTKPKPVFDGKLFENLEPVDLRERGVLSVGDSVRQVVISRNEQRLATLDAGGTIRLWNIETRRSVAEFAGAEAQTTCLALSRTGTRLLVGDADGSVRLMSASDGSQEGTAFPRQQSDIGCLEFLAQDQRAVTVDQSGTLRVWDVSTRTSLMTVETSIRATQLSIFSGGRSVLVGGWEGRLALCQLTEGRGRLIRGWTGPQRIINSLGVSAEEGTGLSTDAQGTIRFWNLDRGEPIRSFAGALPEHVLVTVSENADRLLTADSAGLIQVWDMHSGLMTHRLQVAERQITGQSTGQNIGRQTAGTRPVSLFLSRPGGLAVSIDPKGRLHVWRIPSAVRPGMK